MTKNPSDLDAADAAMEAAAALIPTRAKALGVKTWPEYCALNDSEAVAHLDPSTAARTLHRREGRHPVPLLDEEGALVLRVPAHFKGQTITVLVSPSDWTMLQEGGYRGLWCVNDNGKGRQIVKASRPLARGGKANKQPVARVILDCGANAKIRIINRNSLDLRRKNLQRINCTEGRLTNSRALARAGIALIPKD